MPDTTATIAHNWRFSGPSVIIAWFKLRQRNLGRSWAVNARAKLNIPFGASLTGMARLPEGATQLLADPYAEKQKPWKLYLLLIALAAWAIIAWRGGWWQYLCRL